MIAIQGSSSHRRHSAQSCFRVARSITNEQQWEYHKVIVVNLKNSASISVAGNDIQMEKFNLVFTTEILCKQTNINCRICITSMRMSKSILTTVRLLNYLIN